MEVTLDEFRKRVREDTERTVSRHDQYIAAVEYFNELYEVGSIVPFNEAFTAFQNGVLDFLNEKFEKQGNFTINDIRALFYRNYSAPDTSKDFKIFVTLDGSEFKHGYNYARKVYKNTHPVEAKVYRGLGIIDED